MTDRECKVNPVSSRVCEKGTKSCAIYHQDRELLCKEFTELTGGHWHDFGETKCVENSIQFLHCRECNGYLPNPTYSNPADVLKVMMDRLDWRLFQPKIGVVYDDGQFMIAFGYVMEPDALLKAAVEFLKEENHDTRR
jgi:hypothetical protein